MQKKIIYIYIKSQYINLSISYKLFNNIPKIQNYINNNNKEITIYLN
jgi:hypothetical protein